MFATSEGLYQVSENGENRGSWRNRIPGGSERAYAWPQFMPGGRSVLFTIVPKDSIEGAQIAVLDLKTLEARIVLTGGSAARYASTGHLVYASGQTLKAIAFDPEATTDPRRSRVASGHRDRNRARQRRRRVCRVRNGHAPLHHTQRVCRAAA